MKAILTVVGVMFLVLMMPMTATTNTTSQIGSTVNTTSTGSNRVEQIPVGAFFYVWYGWNQTTQTFTGGNGTSHWNDGKYTKFTDRPLTYYSSMSNETVKWQISEMHRANLTFVAISWWGSNDYTDKAMMNFIKYLDATNDTLQFAILIEPYVGLNLREAQDYVWGIYQQYSEHVFQWEGKPLLASFLPVCPTDTRFTIRSAGNGDGCVRWVYVAGTVAGLDDSGGDWTPAALAEYTNSPFMAADGEVTVMPRFDNYAEYLAGGRTNYLRFNVESNPMMLQQGIQWAETHGAKLIMFTSWNEMTEGSMLEPHYSASGQYIDFVSVLANS